MKHNISKVGDYQRAGGYRPTTRRQLSFKEFCDKKRPFKLQLQQKFVGEYMKPSNKHKELLVFHRIGGGKSCVAIQISKYWLPKGKPLILMPASLIPGFYAELRSPCGSYLDDAERQQLAECSIEDYKKLVSKYNKLIDKDYHLWSYNKFLDHKIPNDVSIIIIDEIQNVDGLGCKFFNKIVPWLYDHSNIPIVCMSATPLFDSAKEIMSLALLLRCVKPDDRDVSIQPKDIKRLFKGKVSYYPGAGDQFYPKTNLKIVSCIYSTFQARWYKAQVESDLSKAGDIVHHKIKNNFYIKSRQRSNIVFPNGLAGRAGLSQLTPSLIKSHLSTYSAKFAYFVKKQSGAVRRKEHIFAYTNFTNESGIVGLKKVIEAHGWLNYRTHGVGPKRYAIWSGDETSRIKDSIRTIFNNTNNDDCSKLQMIIGSPAIKEGVSLLRVRQVHIFEAYWNHSRLEQIFGRASRLCSHARLPSKDRTVDIYVYAGCVSTKLPDKRLVEPTNSVDLYMLSLADIKKEENEPYLDELIDCAIDKGRYDL